MFMTSRSNNFFVENHIVLLGNIDCDLMFLYIKL